MSALEAVPWSVRALAQQLLDEIEPNAVSVTWPRQQAVLILSALIKAVKENHELNNPKAHASANGAAATVAQHVQQASEAAKWESKRPAFLKVEE